MAVPMSSSTPSTVRDQLFGPLATTLLDTIQRLGFGTIVVDSAGNVAAMNSVARAMVERVVGPNKAQHEAHWLRDAVRALSDRATPWFPPNTEAWVTIPCDKGRPLALHRIPLGQHEGATGYIVMILADLDQAPQTSQTTLNRLFGLTPAESRLAGQIVCGGTAVEMANDKRLSVATVRSQLASIFQKTNTRRQSELVLLLTRAAILP